MSFYQLFFYLPRREKTLYFEERQPHSKILELPVKITIMVIIGLPYYNKRNSK